MIFSACPPVYHLPGTWTKCKEAIIPHGNIDPQFGLVIFIVLVLLFVVGYGLDYEQKLRGLPSIYTLTED